MVSSVMLFDLQISDTHLTISSGVGFTVFLLSIQIWLRYFIKVELSTQSLLWQAIYIL
jgi:hypothetical protein